jgi:hypothetical protein
MVWIWFPDWVLDGSLDTKVWTRLFSLPNVELRVDRHNES